MRLAIVGTNDVAEELWDAEIVSQAASRLPPFTASEVGYLADSSAGKRLSHKSTPLMAAPVKA